jgi:hypothetical protein
MIMMIIDAGNKSNTGIDPAFVFVRRADEGSVSDVSEVVTQRGDADLPRDCRLSRCPLGRTCLCGTSARGRCAPLSPARPPPLPLSAWEHTTLRGVT